MDQFQATFKKFLEDEAKDGKDDAFKDFLVTGLNELEGSRAAKLATIWTVAGTITLPGLGTAIGAGIGTAIGGASQAAGSAQLKSYDSTSQDRVNRAAAADKCASAAALADPSGDHRLCDVYQDIHEGLALREKLLFGICDFANACCKDESGKCNCRKTRCDSGKDCTNDSDCKGDGDGKCKLKSMMKACSGGEPKCAPVDKFCKRDHYREGEKIIGAFDALHDTTQFITFSGTTGLDFSWDIAESRGQELTSTHDANVADALGGEVGGGLNAGRRRLESADDRGVPGYAYPISGRVLARSKKLLEVTPEALDSLEEKRRRLTDDEDWSNFGAIFSPEWNAASAAEAHEAKFNDIHAAVTKPESADNPCRRRLDGLEMSDEERRRLGGTICGEFDFSHSSSFAVSLGRAASKDVEHSRSISIFLGDGNAQDIFAVKISQDAIYGTPIFTTMGGRSSCVGETGTTRRDSGVTIHDIKPLCASGGEICDSALKCKCENLAPGDDAFFSVVLHNFSPWVTSVKYLLRAVNGASTEWDSKKYTKALDEACPDGDPGSLEIRAIGSAKPDLRDGDGIIFAPLNYGQHEARIRVSRSADLAPQCFSYSNIQLELVSVCEDTDWDGNQDVYQYNTTMDSKTGAVSVVHPKFVGRPVGDACASDVTLDKDSTDVPDTTYRGDGKWCYSDVNRAMGCTASPADCWSACDEESKACGTVYVSGTSDSDGTYARKSSEDLQCEGKPVLLYYECTNCASARFIKYVSSYWYVAPSVACETTDSIVKSKTSGLADPTKEKAEWQSGGMSNWQPNPEIKVWCALGEESFDLKAIDWEEITGQCRCQNSCECTVEDLYTYDNSKNKGEDGYKTRNTATHLLTKDVKFPPTDEAGAEKTCGLYTFTDASKANGPDTSRATFDVSWAPPPPVLGVEVTPPPPSVPGAEVTGSLCVSGDVSKEVLDELKNELRDEIAQKLKVTKSQVTITTASGGCETQRRRRLEGTSGTKLVYVVETTSVAGGTMVSEASAMMGGLGAIVEAAKAYILDLAACACIENPLVTCPPCPLDKANLSLDGFPDLAPCLCPKSLPCGQCPLDALALTSLRDPELIMLDSPTPEPTSEPTPVLGCKYKAATNFDPLATVDDDSCTFAASGCTYQAASNYDSKATVDDGSCIFAPVCKTCSDDNECELDEFCKFKEDGGRRLRFGSIQREGCCRAP